MNREELRNAFLARRLLDGAVKLDNWDFTDAEFAAVVRELPPLPQLEQLHLVCTQVGDVGMQALAEAAKRKFFPQLHFLALDGTRVGDVGVRALAEAAKCEGFVQLQGLWLYNTQVGDVGVQALAEAAKCQGFVQLQGLSLDHTQVGDVGVRALAEAAKREGFPKLIELRFDNTQVGDLGVEALAEAAKCERFLHLRWLSLDNTQVGDVGVLALAEAAKCQGFLQLRWLSLDNTQVGDVGVQALAEAAKCQGFLQLDMLRLRNTQVSSVLPEVLETRNANQIFKAILVGVALQQVRIALVGMGEVGKTWLFRRLFLNEIVDLREKRVSTFDIDLVRPEVVDWKPVAHYSDADNGTRIEPRVWDFGGQLVLHGVHEIFLTPDRRTVYLLVLAADRVPQRIADKNGHEAGNGLDYWLRTIASFAGSEAPVIVAITRCDRYGDGEQRKIDTRMCPENPGDRRPLVERLTDELFERSGAGVTAIIDGCSATDETKPIEPLREAIEQALGNLSAIKDEKVSPEFIDLMRRVEQEMSGRALATADDFRLWCESEKIEDANAQDTYLRVLHYLGSVFYFGRTPWEEERYDQERRAADDPEGWLNRHPPGHRRTMKATLDPMLQDYLINPEWLKRPLYGIIRQSETRAWMDRDEIIAAIRGVEAELNNVAVGNFPKHRHGDEVIFAVLDRIELCYYDNHKQEYFFPRGRPSDGTPYLPEWAKLDTEDEPVDRCRLTWEFLRESAVHRLIVRWYGEIVDAKHWRYGMVVAKHGCQALVIAKPDNGTVQIDLHGATESNRRRLYEELRRDLTEYYVGQRPKDEQAYWGNEVAKPLDDISLMVESKKHTSRSEVKVKSNTVQSSNREGRIEALGPDARNIIRSFRIFYEGGKEFRCPEPAKSLGEAAKRLESRSHAGKYPEKLAWSKTSLSNACESVARHFGLDGSDDLFLYDGKGTSYAGLSKMGESAWERVRERLLLEEIIKESD